ncbi:hypothetical protein BCR42DRAFT_413613 [Absidia repens]|uniref:Uncharacterized protein n=1 Tax=Absidia repens TaxID=90262 RepID=A0A1X2IHZ8_9FUNG|nr:hypothetical protein BCR42DRAFT_413613 [Absidia repens]
MYRSILRDQYYLLDLKQMWQTKLKKLKMEQMLLDQMCAYTQEDVNDTPPLFNHNDSMPLSNQQHQQQYQQRHSRFLQSHKEQEIRQLDQQDDSYSLDLWTPVSSVHPESSPSSPHSSVYVTADDVVSETNSVADSFYLPGLRSGMNSSSKKSPVSTTTIGFTRATPSSATTTTTAAAQISTTDNNVSNTLLEEYDDSDSNDTASNKEDFIGLADSGNDDSNGEDNGEEEDEETARRALTFMLARYGNDL